MIKDILALVDNSIESPEFLQAVVGIAKRIDAHLEIAVLTPMAMLSTTLAPITALYVPEIATAGDDATAAVRRTVLDCGGTADVWGLHDDAAWLSRDMRSSHPVADLIVIGGEEGWAAASLRRRILETLLLAAGTPILLLPAGRTLVPVRHAALAWKPSAPAMRATHDLVRIAEPGARIDVVCVGQFDPDAPRGSAITDHLVRHGFEVESHWLDDGRAEADQIEAFAISRNADVLAAGAFAHSWVHEILLGGVTRSLTGASFMPILLSH